MIKPEGYHFESLGIVRDGSRSMPEKSVFCKGYHVTEAWVLTGSNHTVSIFSELHASTEKGFTSTNHVTFAAIERGAKLFKKAAYVLDRGYDDNKIFQKMVLVYGITEHPMMLVTNKVISSYYRIADGISELLRYAHACIRDWFKPKRPNQNQLRFRLPA